MCNLIDEGEIQSYLRKGAESTKEIQSLTRAGTSCGRCLPLIDELTLLHKKERPKDGQQKLDFGS